LNQAQSAGKRAYSERPLELRDEAEIRPFDTWPFMRQGIPVIQIGTLGKPFRHWHRPEDCLDLIGASGRRLIADVASLVEDLLLYWTPPKSRLRDA